jgi:RecB family exonuclease
VIDVRRVPYGEPALLALAERVAEAKAGDPLAPVSVVVPTNYAGVATRRALARRGGVAAVHVLTLHRLAERLAGHALAAQGRRPVSAPVVVQAVRAALAEAPGVLAPVADHPATELALAAAQRELAGVPADALDAVAACSERAADVVRLCRAVTDRLAERWHDEHDLLVAATELLVAGGVPGDLGPVVLHLPQWLPPGAGAFLAALAGQVPVSVHVGATGVEEADRPVVDALEAAGIAVPTAAGVARPTATRILSLSDPDDEARAAVRLVVDAVRAGVPLGRMAVLFGAADPYARLVREHLDAAGIPVNGTPVRTVGDMLAGRVLRGLLALPDRGYRRADVFAALSSARLLDGERRVPVRVWDRVSRAAGVVGGDDWSERLATFAEEQRARADVAEADDRAGLAARFRHEADRADDLAGFVGRLRANVDRAERAGSWADLASWAGGLLDRYLGDARSGWPDDEREAADRVGVAVDRLGGLDALGGPPPTVEVFRRLLDGELDTALPRIGRLGEGVLVGTVSLAVGLALDRVVVLGLAEGTFPDRRLDDALLPDRERAAAGGRLALRSSHVDDDHRHLLAAVAAGPTTVCFPRGDLRQAGERTASRWLLDDATALAGGSHRLFTADLASGGGRDWLDVVPSFTAGIAGVTFPATEQEHRLAALLREDGPLSGRPSAATDPVLAAGAALAQARRSPAFTRFDGNLTGLDRASLAEAGRALSATRLQAWAACPHGYLVEHVLGVEVGEEPERRLRLDPLDKGALVHLVLQRFVDEHGRDRERLRAIGEEVCDGFAARGRTGRRLYWRRDRARILADLDRFFTEDEQWRATSGARTVALEHRFDTVVPLAGGGVRLRGAIDRIDRLPDGALHVFDYKTGKATSYAGLSADEPHQCGTRLQPAIYAAGAVDELGEAPVRFDYWFVTNDGGFRWIGYHVDDAVRADVAAALATIVEGIDAGLFPPRPPESPGWNRVDCWFCAPDGLSAAEVRRDWERKRAHPALAAYVALCEPEGDDG